MRNFILVLLVLPVSAVLAKFPTDFSQPLERIAFGSCSRDELPQPVWPAVSAAAPDLWIWAGDNIYADWYQPPGGKKVKYEVDRAWMTERYAAQFIRPDYAAFRAETPILGTWDDHDYGKNNAGSEFPLKAMSRDLALTFMEVPLSDPRWTREGLYGSYDFGPEGQQTRVILTDNRYFATKPGEEGTTILGAAQKEWLEVQLRESPADLHVIVSGSQFVSDQHRWDSWQKYPEDRAWMLDLIRETGARVVFLSGDRHIHEISVLRDESLPYPLADITSSGMTHVWETFPGEPNPHRIGEVITELGYGLVQIDWSDPTGPTVLLEIRDVENIVRNSYLVHFAD